MAQRTATKIQGFTNFPRQKLSTKKKTEDWYKDNIDFAENILIDDEGLRANFKNKRTNYNLRANLINVRDFEKYINPDKRINYYMENIGDYNNNYKFSLLKEKFTNFEPSNNIPFHLGSIFKNGGMNFNEYPNVEINVNKPLFNNNKFLPECCLYNNEYSSDRGCPCITPDQQYYLQRRGVNKHKNDFIHDKNDYKNVFFSPTLALKGEKFPFNPLIDKDYNIHFQKEPPLQVQTEIDEFNKLTNNLSFETQGKI